MQRTVYFTGFGRAEMVVVFDENHSFYKKNGLKMTRKSEISVISG
jgi:hypothetical protein